MNDLLTLLSDEARYCAWSCAGADMFHLRNPTVDRTAVIAFFDAFRTVYLRSHDGNIPDSVASHLIVFRMQAAVHRAQWLHFFFQWLRLWKEDTDVPQVHTVIGCHVEDKNQCAQVAGMHAFLQRWCATDKRLVVVWFDCAPWAVAWHAMNQAPRDTSVLYVWGTYEAFSTDTTPKQLATVICPLHPDVFVAARPRLIAFVDDPVRVPVPPSPPVTRGLGWLPRDLLFHVLQWMDASSGLIAGRVCRSWYEVLRAPEAWRQTRRNPIERRASAACLARIIPGSLTSTGPAFDFYWRRSEVAVKEHEQGWWDSLLQLRDHPAWRSLTVDFTDWSDKEPSLTDRLNEWLDDEGPVEQVQSLHLCGQTVEYEDVGCAPVMPGANSTGWLRTSDLLRAVHFFSRLTSLTMQLEALADCDETTNIATCIATSLPCLTVLHVYDDPHRDVYEGVQLGLEALRILCTCVSLKTLLLHVTIGHTSSQYADEERDNGDTSVWSVLFASPLFACGQLRRLGAWRGAVCCTAAAGVELNDDDDEVDPSAVRGVAHLPPHVQIIHSRTQRDCAFTCNSAHTACVASLRTTDTYS